MSYASCLTAAQTLLSSNVPALTTVAELRNYATGGVSQAAAPAVLLQDVQPSEDRAAHGYKERTWQIDCHLWAYYATLVISPLRTLVESIEDAFRAHPRLGGTADTATTRVKYAGDGPRGIKTTIDDLVPAGRGIYIGHAVVSIAVKEWING